MTRTIIAAVLAALPALAEAGCPTVADMAGGIVFTLDDGSTDTYAHHTNHVVSATFSEPGSPPYRALLAKGVYQIEGVDLDKGVPVPDTRLTIAYPLQPANMPVPQPGGSWFVEAASLDAGQINRETHSYAFGNEVPLTIGACTYRMIRVVVIYDSDDSYTEFLNYLPELGLSYYAGFIEGGQRTDYPYIDVRAVK